MLENDVNRELFEEQFEVLMKPFNEASFSHKGKHYTLPPDVPYRGYQLREITLVPRPLHRPVEVWQPIVSGTPRAFDFMARHGIKGAILGTAAEYEDVLQKRAWICATPDEMIDYLKAIEAQYSGLEHIMLGFPFGATAAQFKGQLTRFAREVMPAFSRATAWKS